MLVANRQSNQIKEEDIVWSLGIDSKGSLGRFSFLGASLICCCHGGIRGRVHEIPLTAGVAVRQQRNGL